MTEISPPDTAGLRAHAQALRIAAAYAVEFPWSAGLAQLLDMLNTRAGAADRFERVEATAFGSPLPLAHPGSQYSGLTSAPPTAFPVVSAQTGSAKTASATTEPAARDGRAVPSPTVLPQPIRHRVERELGTPLPAIGVHDNGAADAAARAHGADAVTVGTDVYFRQGRYRPDDPAGFALLVHEASHISEGPASRRGSPAEVAAEEDRALAAERAVLNPNVRPLAGPTPPTTIPVQPGASWATAILATPGPAVPSDPYRADALIPQSDHRQIPATAPVSLADRPPANAPAPAAPQAGTPMRAAVDRELSPSTSVDPEALRRSIIDEMKRLMRNEFERGA